MTMVMRPLPGPAREYQFPRFSRTSTTNGIDVIVATVSKLPLVSVVTVTDVSALADAPGKEGLAELTAQALNEGTTTQDGTRLVLDLEKLGTSLQTGADWDGTSASLTVMRDNLPAAFRILAEVLTSPAFRVEDVERLKSERLAERLQLLDEPRGLADESFARFIYAPSARYSEPLAGTSRSVSSISSADVNEFYRRSFTPTATTVIFAGDITVDAALQLVETTLGSWRGDRGIVTPKADDKARRTRAVEIVAKADAAQSELRIGHAGVERTHPDYFRIVVMNAVLGGLFSSRINLNLREVHGYTYSASSYYDWRRQAGPFVVSSAVQSEVTAAAISETLKEIDRMRDEKIGDDELTLATSYLEGVFPIRYETTGAIAAALANLVTFGLPEDYYDTYRANIRSVTAEDVLDAARDYVKPEELQITVVGNEELIRQQVEALGIGTLSVHEATEP